MRFPQISRAFRSVRKAFDDFDKDKTGTIDYDELKVAMKRLGAHLDVGADLLFHCKRCFDYRGLSIKLTL